MSTTTTTTRISRKWLERKSKHELAGIIMNNLDKIDLFADSGSMEWNYKQALSDIEAMKTDMAAARKHCERAQKMTEVPAAEYVPALCDAWDEIQKAIGLL